MPDQGRRQELLRIESQVRTIRWLAIPFAIVQFLLYRPPEGVTITYDPIAAATALAAVLMLTNLGSIATGRLRNLDRLVLSGDIQLAVDTALALGVVWLYIFDPASALWALFILPVLEGAIRRQLRGALLTWAAVSVGYVIRELAAPSVVPGATFAIDSVTYRVGIIFVVAAATGFLAKNLEGRMVAHEAARKESERRSELLHIVAQAGRSMNTLEPNDVLRTVVEACVEAGFQGAGIATIDHESETFSFAEYRGMPAELASMSRPTSTGTVGEVQRSRASVVFDETSEWIPAAEEARALGYRAVVASPIMQRGELVAVLIVGTRERSRVSANEKESLELLAAHAGAALSTANHFRERQQLKQRLEYESFFDSLTGLPNRQLFVDRLAHCLDRKASSPSPTAVMMIDLDRFKKVNESFGHQVGDELIRLVSRRLQVTRAPGDTVARYGDDDFIVLIEEPEGETAVIDHAARVVDDLKKPFVVDGQDVYISASVGVAYGQTVKGQDRDLVREADVAMYRAKERGGGRAEIYRPVMTALARRRMELEVDLRRAIEHGELLVHYQPAMSLSTGEIAGLEALVRWRHPKRGLVSASEFIPVAEDSGLIVPLGNFVLERVTAQMRTWNEAGSLPAMATAVNVSAAEFGQSDFVDRLLQLIEFNGLDPSQLLLEVTETVVMRDDRVTSGQMRKLEDCGLRLAIDDFGLGYSALSYLKRFRFSVLKIDRSFITDVATRSTDQAIVRYVLALAGDLGIPVVAEGVETEDQLDYLRSVECGFVQGFHLCRPLAPEELERFVASRANGNGASNGRGYHLESATNADRPAV